MGLWKWIMGKINFIRVETVGEFFKRLRGKRTQVLLIMPNEKRRFKYFTEDEVMGLDYEFTILLDRAREISGVPYIITSGYRNPEANETVGGAKNSSHSRGFAVDIRCHDSPTRFKILKGIFSVGFCRVGVYDKHVHVDNDYDLPQGVVWVGKSH